MTRKHLIPGFIWLVLSIAASAASPPPATTPQKTALSDAELERAIRARLAASKSAADKFTVRVQGGVATQKLRFAIREGGRTVGAGVVVSIIK